MLDEVGVQLHKSQFALDSRPLLKLVLSQFFGDASGFVQMAVTNFPDPRTAARSKVTSTYMGDLRSPAATAMLACDKKGALMVNVTKMFPRPDASGFDAFGRVLSGTLRVGDDVRVLGEAYSLEDKEDMTMQKVSAALLRHSGCGLYCCIA